MPCNTVQMTEVDVSKYQRHILEAALKDLGYAIDQHGSLTTNGWTRGCLVGTRLDLYGSGEALKQALPKAYSRRLVLHQAKRAGWKVRERAGKIQLLK